MIDKIKFIVLIIHNVKIISVSFMLFWSVICARKLFSYRWRFIYLDVSLLVRSILSRLAQFCAPFHVMFVGNVQMVYISACYVYFLISHGVLYKYVKCDGI